MRSLIKMALNNRVFLFALMAIAVGFIIYFNSLNNPFQFDDNYLIVKNTKIFELGNAPDFFTSPILTDSGGFSGYRPLVMVSYALNYHFSGLNPAPYRLVNLMLHIINSILLLMLLLKLMPHIFKGTFLEDHVYPMAFVASGIFLIHPVNTIAINFIWKRTTLMCSFFMLLAAVLFLSVHIRFYNRRDNLIKRVFSLLGMNLLLLFAILSKEEGVLLPFALMLIFALSCQKKHIRAFGLEMLPMLLIVGAYSYFRIKYFGTLLEAMNFRGVPITKAPPMTDYLMAQTEAIVRYMGLLLFPQGLSIFHEVRIPKSVFELGMILRSLFLAGLIVFALMIGKRHRWFTFSVLWFFLFLIPTSFIVPLNILMDEIRVYLPQIGFSICIAVFVFYIYGFLVRKRGQRAAKRVVVLFLVLLGVLMSSNSYIRNYFYKNEYLTWLDAVDKAPNSLIPRLYLGNLLREAGRYEKALEQFKKAIEIDPANNTTKDHLGLVYQLMDDKEKAIELYNEVLAANNNDYYAHQNLGIMYSRAGEYDKAKFHLERATKIHGLGYPAFMELGKVYMFEGNARLASNYLHEAYAINRYDFLTSRNLSLLYFDLLNKPEKGIAYAKISLALENRQPDLRKKVEEAGKYH